MTVSRDVNRIEAFSDAVFGFALTLLVVSLEVPRTYADMMQNVRALPAFAASFAILLMIWQEHHNFFRRYGVHDGVHHLDQRRCCCSWCCSTSTR